MQQPVVSVIRTQAHRRCTRRRLHVGLLAVLLADPIAMAQSGASYDLHWNVIGGGGGTSTSAGGYQLTGVVGQAAVDPLGAAAGANGYALQAGFLTPSGTAMHDQIFAGDFE